RLVKTDNLIVQFDIQSIRGDRHLDNKGVFPSLATALPPRSNGIFVQLDVPGDIFYKCSAPAQANASLIGESLYESESCSVARRLYERNLPRALSTRGFARSDCSAQHDRPHAARGPRRKLCAVVATSESKIVAAMQQERWKAVSTYLLVAGLLPVRISA